MKNLGETDEEKTFYDTCSYSCFGIRRNLYIQQTNQT